MSGFGMADEHLRDKRILVVDDERDLADMVAAILHGAGFARVDVAHSGEEALAVLDRSPVEPRQGRGASGRTSPTAPHATEEIYQLFVLDVMMPGMDGFELLARLREHPAHAQAPVVFLTAKDEPFDRVSGLSLGADDYIAKPFLPQELVLRVTAVLRRCYAEESPLLDLDACRVNFATAEVLRADGETAVLTAKEHEILGVLARNAGRIVTIDSLCEACWGTSFGYENSLMAHIRRLREKIEADPSKPVSLVTARGLGYKLVKRG
ncbi:two-component system response regulator [Gordonibacter sp. An230]|nr:response regulator transcription factor [Gordonibacter sp. An230]OUO87777.1 two-component system response regulator [Gordonibacter sp. An230]